MLSHANPIPGQHEMRFRKTARFVVAVFAAVLLQSEPAWAQQALPPCAQWSQAQTQQCAAREAVMPMDGVASDRVRRPVKQTERPVLEKAGRAALKAVLFVPRLAIEFLLIPVRGTITMVGEYQVIERTRELLFNDAGTAAVIPLAGFESGFGPNIGVTAFHRDLLGYGEKVAATARWGGRYVQSYQLRFEARRLSGAPVWTDARARFESNPALLFAGLGPPTQSGPFGGFAGPQTHYAQDRALGLLGAGVVVGNKTTFEPGLRGIVNWRRYDDPEPRAGVTPISSEYETADLVGFDSGITTIELQAVARVDARQYRGLWRRGWWFEGFAGLLRAPDYAGHIGAELVLDVPFWLHTRILSFRVAAEGVTGGADSVAFSELPRLGGFDRLRGYASDTYRDVIATLASVEYTYPIHKNVSGNLFVDAGRVGPDVPDMFRVAGWRLGGGGGVLVGSEDDITVRLSIAGGDRLQFLLGADLARAFDGRGEQL